MTSGNAGHGEVHPNLADDNDIVRTIIRLFLETKGFAICGEAVDGVDAIEKAKQLKPDLIVLDVAMPRMNGCRQRPF